MPRRLRAPSRPGTEQLAGEVRPAHVPGSVSGCGYRRSSAPHGAVRTVGAVWVSLEDGRRRRFWLEGRVGFKRGPSPGSDLYPRKWDMTCPSSNSYTLFCWHPLHHLPSLLSSCRFPAGQKSLLLLGGSWPHHVTEIGGSS